MNFFSYLPGWLVLASKSHSHEIDARIDKATSALLALLALHPFLVKHNKSRRQRHRKLRKLVQRMLIDFVVVPVFRRSLSALTCLKQSVRMFNHVSLNRRGGIFSSVYREGTVRKGEQIYHRVARAYLCLLDDFYCETVKR